MNETQIKNIVEAALMAAGQPLTIDRLLALFEEAGRPERKSIREAIEKIQADYADRGIKLNEVASGYRIQVRPAYGEWVSRLWQERPPRYSRALMETMALIAYRQPVTRGEIEEIRGVSVSANIIRTLLERGWARVVGHRDVPGKPEMFGTTREFLDYFDLKSLDELPTLGEIQDFDNLNVELDLQAPGETVSAGSTPTAVSQDMPSAETGEESTAVTEAGGEPQPLTIVSTESAPAGQQPEDLADPIASDPSAIEESGDKSIA
ncbi:MAG: SMC-Scp complex subunit ScpB [Proteobacteria bacterium]|nr:SMC-Scp complex subunit ScpB [Pseudomonadota bacterium]